jgi:antitoxin component YwqK of YwqJK toxin-antitoxin module
MIMKKMIILLVAVFAMTAVQAQEKIKNSYIDKGDIIEATIYFEDGSVSQEGFFTKEGKLTGDWISYNREGAKVAEAQYENGDKVGTWFFWKGDTLTEVSYTNSRIASVNTWKNEGSRVVSNR